MQEYEHLGIEYVTQYCDYDEMWYAWTKNSVVPAQRGDTEDDVKGKLLVSLNDYMADNREMRK